MAKYTEDSEVGSSVVYCVRSWSPCNGAFLEAGPVPDHSEVPAHARASSAAMRRVMAVTGRTSARCRQPRTSSPRSLDHFDYPVASGQSKGSSCRTHRFWLARHSTPFLHPYAFARLSVHTQSPSFVSVQSRRISDTSASSIVTSCSERRRSTSLNRRVNPSTASRSAFSALTSAYRA